MIAKTKEERALLAASQKVTKVARRFGYTQGAVAQEWVEKAIATKDASSETLLQMQLTLFDECSIDDDSGRCKALSEAVDAMKAAVEAKASAAVDTKKKGFKFNLGPSELQAAATKVREAATRFGPSQKEAANAWIKEVTALTTTEASPALRDDLLTQKIALFGECYLSEDGTPSDCELLEQALTEFQEAVEFCDIASQAAEEACRAAEVLKQLEADFAAGKTVSWYDRGVRLEPAAASSAPAAKAAAAPAAAASKKVALAPMPAAPPSAEAALNTLMVALRQGTQGRDQGSKSAMVAIERAADVAEAVGVDAGKVAIARSVVEKKGGKRNPVDRESRFW